MSKNKYLKIQIKPLFLPAAVFLIFWPILVHMEDVETGLEHMPWYPDTILQSDFFMNIRSHALLLISIWMLVVLIDRYLLQRISKLKLKTAAPLLIYAILVVFSAVFSVNRAFSFSGFSELFETVWVLLSYLVVCWYFADTVQNYQCKNQMISYILIGAVIQVLIGISQYFGHDFWSSTIGSRIIQTGREEIIELQFLFGGDGKNQVYMSFYNPNYAGVYIILILPLAVYTFFLFHKIWQKILCVLLIAALLLCLLGTESETGMITVCILFVAGGILYIHSLKKRMLYIAVCIICITYFVAQSFLSSENSLVQKIINNAVPEQKHYKLQEVVPGQNEIKLVFDDHIYQLKIEQENGSSWFSITDEEDRACRLEYNGATGRFTFADDKYKNLEFQVSVNGEECRITMYRLNIPWLFIKENEKMPYQYYTLYGKPDIPVNADFAFGKGYERAFSGRVYLWSRSVPLIKNYLIIGSGPDTFALVFPQNDYVTRANQGIDMLMQIISKPHSYYLQTAIQTGLASLFMLIWFIGRYLYQAVLRLRQSKGTKSGDTERKERMYQIAILLSIIGFLIMGITNDSVVVTTPIFWAILGIGCGSLNRTAEFR